MRGFYRDMVEDGQYPGLVVHPYCRDEKHPTEKPYMADDAVILRKPSPDTDDDSPGSSTTLVSAFGWDHYFGGNT